MKQRSQDIQHRSQDAEPGDRAGISGDCSIPVREPNTHAELTQPEPRRTLPAHNAPRGPGVGGVAEPDARAQLGPRRREKVILKRLVAGWG